MIALNRESRSFHHPWVAPPQDRTDYWEYFLRCGGDDFRGFFICRHDDQRIAGVVNLSQLFFGNFCSAYLGYYGCARYVRQGYMTEGLSLVVERAFTRLRLHRLEANIQPANEDSIKLVQRLGFSNEGYSRRYLKIDGEWRDHQRWAILAEDWAARVAGGSAGFC